MKKIVTKLILVLALLALGYGYYYVTLPAISIHSKGFWAFLLSLLIIATIVVTIKSISTVDRTRPGKLEIKGKSFKIMILVTTAFIVIFVLGSFTSSRVINAKKYQQLISISERNFAEDIEQISFNKIPLLDRASATLLGSRKMGSMVEYVSQFEVSDDYTQINYQGKPVRVTPLKYGSFFKWFNNRKDGIPAYIMIDMATQDVSCIKLTQTMKYGESEKFGRNIHRYLRFHYPTYIFDDLTFEINEEGTPYWVCPVKDFTIGLFGGEKISRVVLVNAVTGELSNYKIDEVPTWVDTVYSPDLLISYYDYYGTLKHGYWNTLFSQKGCLQTTDGYNYIALDDDVWVYTGVTSVGGDESNVGFVLMNQRTAETRYYSIAGAEEYSAMASAEGQVQNLNYVATFPLLLNISGEPTYFIALKDSAGLVKKYAMVNIAKYQIVAIGDTVAECEKTYNNLMKTSGITLTDTSALPTATGNIKKISPAVIDGNTHYYILLDNSDLIFDILVSDYVDIVRYDVGDEITFVYTSTDSTALVNEIK